MVSHERLDRVAPFDGFHVVELNIFQVRFSRVRPIFDVCRELVHGAVHRAHERDIICDPCLLKCLVYLFPDSFTFRVEMPSFVDLSEVFRRIEPVDDHNGAFVSLNLDAVSFFWSWLELAAISPKSAG